MDIQGEVGGRGRRSLPHPLFTAVAFVESGIIRAIARDTALAMAGLLLRPETVDMREEMKSAALFPVSSRCAISVVTEWAWRGMGLYSDPKVHKRNAVAATQGFGHCRSALPPTTATPSAAAPARAPKATPADLNRILPRGFAAHARAQRS